MSGLWHRIQWWFHRHAWVLVIDPPERPGCVFLECEQCGARSSGWQHGPN